MPPITHYVLQNNGNVVTALLSRFLSKPPYGGSISFMLDNVLSILIEGRMSADTSSPFPYSLFSLFSWELEMPSSSLLQFSFQTEYTHTKFLTLTGVEIKLFRVKVLWQSRLVTWWPVSTSTTFRSLEEVQTVVGNLPGSKNKKSNNTKTQPSRRTWGSERISRQSESDQAKISRQSRIRLSPLNITS